MATRGAGDKGPVVHPVLATLAGDVHPGDAVRLQGYVGPTKNGETLRLYAALEDLSDYIDIPRDEVLRSAEAPEAVAPKGGVYVWVKPDAQLVYTRTHSATALARDLGGASALEAQLANEFRRRNPGATVLTSLTAEQTHSRSSSSGPGSPASWKARRRANRLKSTRCADAR